MRDFLRNEDGQDLVEYGLLLAFVALASAALFANAGKSVQTVWGSAGNSLGGGICPYNDYTEAQQAQYNCHY